MHRIFSWAILICLLFFVSDLSVASAQNLIITEIMFNPNGSDSEQNGLNYMQKNALI